MKNLYRSVKSAVRRLFTYETTVQEENRQRYNQVRAALVNLNTAVRRGDSNVVRLYSEEAVAVLNNNKPQDYVVTE